MSGARRRDTRYLPEAARQGDGEEETLLVFGYHCKIFRDDEKAMFIERKKHLIPWMGDSSLMIDRYDGRGHLYDLRAYDADQNKGKYAEFTDEEKRIEALIDEERYLELHTDIAERAMYEEEELKRLNEEVGGSYGAVNFNYDYSAQAAEQESGQGGQYEETKEDSDGEEPFEVPDALKVPYGMEVPTTVKENAIIEKTAQFVSKQGAQMEIVIKTKQQNNPSFEFLNFSHVWNPYYKHMVRMIKSGLYKPQIETKRKRTSSSSDDGKYLHPALTKKDTAVEEQISSKKFLESVKAKLPSGQITNTLYSKLVSNLSKHTGRDSPVPAQRGSNGDLNATQAPQPTDQYAGHGSSARPHGFPPPPSGPPPTGPPASYMPGATDGMYGSNYPGVPPPPGMEPVTLPPGTAQPPPPGTQPPPPGTGPPDPLPYVDEPNTTESQTYPHQDPYYSSSYDYHHQQQSAHPSSYPTDYMQHPEEHGPQPYSTAEPQPQVEYGPQPAPTASPVPKVQDEPPELEGPQIIPPPPDILPVIDKMASYVAKNGPAFEYVVKNKADGRFDFVHDWHQHNAYYEYKKKVYTEEHKEEKRLKEAEEKQKQEEDDEAAALSGQSKAVTFTMKPKKQEKPALKTRTALLYESSDEDEDSESGERRERVEGNVSESIPSFLISAAVNNTINLPSGQQSPTPPNTDRQSAEDNKLAEDKLKDKLAIAAKEKLAAANKEKLIQAERKRKAAMFAAMLKSSQQDKELQQQTATQRAQAAVQAAGEDPAAGIQPPILKGAAIPPPLSLLSSSTTPTTSRSTSPAVSTLKDSKASTPARSFRSKSPTEKFYKKRKSRSRSRSPKRKRSRSKERNRRSRSRSNLKSSRRHKSRSRSRSPRKRRKSKSRSKSPRRRKRSKSPTSHQRKSPSRRKRTRSRSKSPNKVKKKKSKRSSRSRSRSRRSRSKSRSKSSKHKSPSKKKSKKKKKAKSRSRSPTKVKQPSTVISTEDNSEEIIEIKSESGDEDSSVHEEEPAAVEVSTVTAQPTLLSGADTSDAVVESSDQGEADREEKTSSAVESPAAASLVSVDSPRVAPRAKQVVDMFEQDPSDVNSPGSSPASRSQDSNSGTVSPGGTTFQGSKKNVSKDMLMKVRAMLKASRSSHEDS